MADSPELSIITAVYNDADNLLKTIASIKSQRFSRYELIVIDGKSSDGTLEVIRQEEEYIDCWISESDDGVYDAMNKGIKVSAGKYLEFLNAGDTYVDDNSLDNVFSANDKDYDALFGEINVFDKDNKFLFSVPARDFTIENLKRFGTGTVNHQAFFIKKEKAPLFSTKYRLKSELNWYCDILMQNEKITYKHLPLPIIDYKQGGKGYKQFWRNLFEWIILVQRRFGIIQNMRNTRTYWNFIKYRYPILKKKIRLITLGSPRC